MTFLKLKDINEFEIENVSHPYWVSWDTQSNRYNRYNVPTKNAQKKWDIILPNKDRLPVSNDQMSQILVQNLIGTKADIVGSKFSVHTNGKEGKEIRYFLEKKNV